MVEQNTNSEPATPVTAASTDQERANATERERLSTQAETERQAQRDAEARVLDAEERLRQQQDAAEANDARRQELEDEAAAPEDTVAAVVADLGRYHNRWRTVGEFEAEMGAMRGIAAGVQPEIGAGGVPHGHERVFYEEPSDPLVPTRSSVRPTGVVATIAPEPAPPVVEPPPPAPRLREAPVSPSGVTTGTPARPPSALRGPEPTPGSRGRGPSPRPTATDEAAAERGEA